MDFRRTARTYSLLGQRGTFGVALRELASRDARIVALSCDLTRTAGLERFAEDYPDRVYNVGIAEENAIGMAAGMADEGYVPFVTTFSNFAALRANEFVRHFMAYMKCNVKLVGFGAGFAMEFFGNTHYGLEDVAVLRSMPNLTILSPADCVEVAKCIEWAASNDGPVYIRLSGKMNNPMVHRNDFDFVAGKAIRLQAGDGVSIIATGSMVNVAMMAAKALRDEGIEAAVYDFHTIKPLDEMMIREAAQAPVVVTVEEHCLAGGLGTAVAEVLASGLGHGRLVRLGAGDAYMRAGSYEYMLACHGLTTQNLVATVKDALGR